MGRKTLVAEHSNEPDRPKPAGLWRRLVSKHPFRRGTLLILLGLVVEYLVLPQIAGVGHSLHLLRRVNIGFVLLGLSRSGQPGELCQVDPNRSSTAGKSLLEDLADRPVDPRRESRSARRYGGRGRARLSPAHQRRCRRERRRPCARHPGDRLGTGVKRHFVAGPDRLHPLDRIQPHLRHCGDHRRVAARCLRCARVASHQGEERAATALGSVVRRLPFLHQSAADTANRLVHQIAARIRVMAADRALLRRAVLWAAANWLLDAASLYVFLVAFGKVENPDGLLVAYGLAFVLAAIPVTPGGLGVVEGVLVPSLVGFGATRGIAIVAVIAYRLVNFWLPIPVGAGAYLSMASGGLRGSNRTEKLKHGVADAQSPTPLSVPPTDREP